MESKVLNEYTIAIIQMDCYLLDVKKNVDKAILKVREAAIAGAKLVCLPEAFNTGYYGADLHKVAEMAETLEENTIRTFMNLSKDLGIFIVAPIFIKNEGIVTNSAILISDEGKVIGKYDKSHPIGVENRIISKGKEYPVWNTKIGKIGFLICYDVCFPETAKALSINDVDIIIVPSAWRGSRYYKEWWKIDLQARALDNLVYIAGINRVGKCGTESFAGTSLLCDYTGKIIGSLSEDKEDILYGTIQYDAMLSERKKNTVLDDWFIEDYSRIANEYQKEINEL